MANLLFYIAKNIIQIKVDKDVKFLGQDLMNITIKIGQSVKETKMHHLVLTMIISS